MNIILTCINLLAALTACVLFIICITRSEYLFIKARARDIRVLLTADIINHERQIREMLLIMITLSLFFVSYNLSRVFDDFPPYTSRFALFALVVIHMGFLRIGYLSYKTSKI